MGSKSRKKEFDAASAREACDGKKRAERRREMSGYAARRRRAEAQFDEAFRGVLPRLVERALARIRTTASVGAGDLTFVYEHDDRARVGDVSVPDDRIANGTVSIDGLLIKLVGVARTEAIRKAQNEARLTLAPRELLPRGPLWTRSPLFRESMATLGGPNLICEALGMALVDRGYTVRLCYSGSGGNSLFLSAAGIEVSW